MIKSVAHFLKLQIKWVESEVDIREIFRVDRPQQAASWLLRRLCAIRAEAEGWPS